MSKYAIGIDLGGTNTRIALVGKGCHIIARRQFSTKMHKTKDRLIDAIALAVCDIIAQRNLTPAQICGIGIGTPGLVDSKSGIVHNLTNIPGWEKVNLKKLLQHKTRIATYVDNDTNLMALAESRFGAAKDAQDVFCITLGTGVGGGIVINGEVYRGSTQSAGEIGHVPIDFAGPKCNCGSRGCLEAYVGNNAVVRRAVRMISVTSGGGRKGRHSILKGLVKGRLDKITPELITEAAAKGDALAKEAWSQTARYLSAALVFIVNVLDPEVIVIGGGIAGAGRFLFEPLRKLVRKNAMPVSGKAVKIVKAKLGNDAGIIGAAIFVRSLAPSDRHFN